MSLPKRARPNRAHAVPSSSSTSLKKDSKVRSYVVVGGGIAGVSCAKELQRHIDSNHAADDDDNGDCTIMVTLVSATDVLKESAGVMKISKFLEEVEVFERSCDHFLLDNPRVRILKGILCSVDHVSKELHLDNGQVVPYDKLCLCTGAVPKLLSSTNSKNIIGIRDVDSVADLLSRLESGPAAIRAKKVLIAGNGGIALELVHALLEAENSCSVDWLVRDGYAGKAFFDASAAAFVMPSLKGRIGGNNNASGPVRLVGTTIGDCTTYDARDNTSGAPHEEAGSTSVGAALGPDWLFKSDFIGSLKKGNNDSDRGGGGVSIHFNEDIVSFYDCQHSSWVFVSNSSRIQGEHELEEMMAMAKKKIDSDTYPVHVLTATGALYSCDFIVSATGVTPNTAFAKAGGGHNEGFSLDNEGALFVDRKMRTNLNSIYAAGDCCHCNSISSDDITNTTSKSSNWFQMRLWSQARCMGVYAAHCMLGVEDNYGSDYFFEIFAHITRFFGYKVVLLGRYNCQGLGDDVEERVKDLVVTESGLVRRDKSLQYAQGSTDGECVDTDMKKNIVVSRSSEDDPSLQLWTRVTSGKEYIKLVVKEGRVIGALLIGDTDIEETVENLILNQLDVSQQGAEILNPDVDIEDYFD